MATIYAQAAREMSMVASQEVLSGVGKDRIHGPRMLKVLPDKIVSDYTRNILNGGTDCIERVLTLQPSGMYKATTRTDVRAVAG